jgi:hypothetical protein
MIGTFLWVVLVIVVVIVILISWAGAGVLLLEKDEVKRGVALLLFALLFTALVIALAVHNISFDTDRPVCGYDEGKYSRTPVHCDYPLESHFGYQT